MVALVTLEHAKLNLGVSIPDNDLIIQLKIELASAEILDYLKSRAHESQTSAVIESSSVASPTVITTVSPHTFVNGSTVVLSGHVGSVPSINGSYVIADVTASSFTVPIAVTTEGTGGTASTPWTADTVPGQVQDCVLVLLTHMNENPGDNMKADEDVWKAIERRLARSRDPAFA